MQVRASEADVGGMFDYSTKVQYAISCFELFRLQLFQQLYLICPKTEIIFVV